ncbi:hypothetical protein ETSB_0793 [cyanobacterium endosymbiont of Epithemia turgida isolate EtSB Lake Yunoko]|nr:hypothetical protein ETSB_0793 [cyanobacterium endosymbiont of Epithemia turgida isolate EtSB Lake Yunoko]
MLSFSLLEMNHHRYQLGKYTDALIGSDQIVVCNRDLEDIAINFVIAIE